MDSRGLEDVAYDTSQWFEANSHLRQAIKKLFSSEELVIVIKNLVKTALVKSYSFHIT